MIEPNPPDWVRAGLGRQPRGETVYKLRDAILADVADNVVIFDVVDPLRGKGKVASRQRATEWVATYDGPIKWESSDVQVVADGDVAFSHALSRVTGTLKTGTKVDM